MDLVLYTGAAQRAALLPGYTCDGALPEPQGAVVGNYIEAGAFPYVRRRRTELAAGRVSRADGAKFPALFPLTYHGLRIPRLRCRVLGWSPAVAGQWPWYDFVRAGITGELPAGAAEWGFREGVAAGPVPRWSLYAPGAVETRRFYESLDLYLYDVGPGLRESWGRTVVEAMLSGLPVLIPGDRRHHLHELVPDGVAGFHCGTPECWLEAARRLAGDAALRARMGRAAARHARSVLCNAAEHRRVWREALG